MFRPAELYDSDDYMDMDNDGFSCGDEFTRPSREPYPSVPNVYTPSQIAARLRMEREENIIRIIQDGTLAELAEMHDDPIGINLSALLLNDWPPLFHAAHEWRQDKLAWLLAHGADANQCVGGVTALLAACMSAGNECTDERVLCGCVRTLLTHGAVLNIGDRLGRTPLMHAARNGHQLTVGLMVHENAALEACDNVGDMVLFHAIECKQVDTVRLLQRAMNCGTTADIINGKGITARDWAESCGLEQLDELFPIHPEYVLPPEFMVNHTVDALAPTVFPRTDVPPFFFDVREMLVGMRSEPLVQHFAEANLGLFDFLTVDVAQLERIGVPYPFQRNRVRLLLQLFHERQFSPRSLRSLAKRSQANTADLFAVVAGHLKHLLIVRSSVDFALKDGYAADDNPPDVSAMLTVLAEIREKIDRMRHFIDEMQSRAPRPVQHIAPACGAKTCLAAGLAGWQKLVVVAGVIAIAGTVTARMCMH